MKFVIATLLLGCVALASKFAAQSEFFCPNVAHPHSRDLPRVLLTLDQIGFTFPRIPIRSVTSCLIYPVDAAPKVRMTKAEALVLIESAAIKHRVAAAFVESIVAAESNFDADAVSPKGAIGLMQLMPETARQFGADPTEPAQNVDAGTQYLRLLMDRYSKKRHSLTRVIAAYNAGPGKVDRYRGVPPYRETRAYVARVLGFLNRYGAPERYRARG